MSYLGQVELKSSEIRRVDVTGSTSATHTLTWTPASEQSLIITINGIKQQNNYSISGVTLTLDDALLSDDKMEVIGILDIGEAVTPPDDSISTAKIQDDAVTADKLANSINTEITANTAKVTNATHTGDVTGATALTIATDAVDIAMLSATGTADATTFLRGDNAWVAPGGGKVLQVVLGEYNTYSTTDSATFTDTGLSATITPTATSSSILAIWNMQADIGNNEGFGVNLVRDSTEVWAQGYNASTYGYGITNLYIYQGPYIFIDSPSTTSATTYKTQVMVHSGTIGLNGAGVGYEAPTQILLMEIAA